MILPQPGQVQKYDTGITLGVTADAPIMNPNPAFAATTSSGYRFLYNSSQFVLTEYSTETHRMEANVWNNDGSVASNFFFSKPRILDVTYDTNDQVYYGLRWNDEQQARGGGFTFAPVDEGGSESAVGLLIDEFTEEKVWHIKPLPSLLVDTVISYKPGYIDPRITRDTRSWTNYVSRTYTGYPTSWALDSWGSSSNFSSVDETKALNLLQIDEDSQQLVFYSNVGLGYLDFDVEIEGNFVAYVDLNVTTLEADCVVSLRALRESDRAGAPFNEMASVSYRGPQGGARLQTWSLVYTNDSTAAAWNISGLRINERYLDIAAGGITSIASGSSETFTVIVDDYRLGTTGPAKFGDFATQEHILALSVVDSSGTNYGRAVLGSNIDLEDHIDSRGVSSYGDMNRSFSWVGSSGQVLGVDLVAGFGFDSVNGVLTDYIDATSKGSSVDVVVSMFKEAGAPGIDNDKLRLAIKRIGTTVSLMKRDNTVAGGSYTEVSSYDSNYSGPVRFELFCDALAGTASPDVVMDRFVVRGLFTSEETGEGTVGYASWPHPVLTLEAYDLDGNLTEAAGVSDASGSVLAKLDVVKAGKDSIAGAFDSFLGLSQVATNHDSATASGEVFINVNTDFYKYLKSALPIVTVESGTQASLVVGGGLFGDPIYNTLNWNGYTEAGLMYIAENEADPGSGLYVNVIRHTTMSGNSPVKFAWIESAGSSDFKLYATDVNQPTLLYGLSTTDRKVYLYNFDETSSAFCNVVSQKQILGASTAENSSVTAQVLNVYGDPLVSKTVNFDVSSGDGSVSPSSDITDAVGEAATTYTVGATVGTATIRATVID